MLGIGLIGVGGAMIINKVADYVAPIKWRPEYKIQQERAERLEEFQKIQQKENQMFQAARDINQQNFQMQRDADQRRFQMEMEANRLAFQERIEMRRLQVQQQLEQKREKLTIALQKMNMKNNQDIARFNAIAMRETQILVARENSQNLLQDRMVQDALKNFPLNISPLVLLKNRPHSLSSLLRFTIGEEANINDVARDVMNYAENPEALNIFVAPVYVDSKIKNREILSKQIWDTTYQRLESFFTEHYNRRSQRPVIFYPTAWNDKYSPGMHASETLHFFLKDMPCIVLEPRFDGNNFRIMVSAWGLGYTSTEHIRTELNFNINIDAILAYSAYKRSDTALNVLADLEKAEILDADRTTLQMQRRVLERNVKFYESLHIEERIAENKMNEIDALGIYNIFKIEPTQDLTLLSDMLSAQIGMTLASLTDIHHLRSTDVSPIFPRLMKTYFPQLFDNKQIKELLYKSYEKIFIYLHNEDTLMLTAEDRARVENIREQQIREVGFYLELSHNEDHAKEIETQMRKYCKDIFKFEDENFELIFETCLDEMSAKDKPFFEKLLPQITNQLMYRKLKRRLNTL